MEISDETTVMERVWRLPRLLWPELAVAELTQHLGFSS